VTESREDEAGPLAHVSVVIDWSDYSTVIPAFVALIAIPFSYSITTGIVLGFIVHVLLNVLSGTVNEVPVILWAVFVLSVVLLLI
jgi:AGZA family xanthine/uracil permease-like MFS transporter